MRHTPFIAAALLAALPQARGDVVDIRWSADAGFTHKAAVAAGKFVEVCGKLAAGQNVRWRFEATAPVDFNVHYHLGKDVEYPAKLSAVTTGEDTLQVMVGQDYCWMWSNKSSVPAMLSVNLASVSRPGETGQAEGSIVAIDTQQGRVTLKHGAIEGLGMPAMTMVFRVADPSLLVPLKVGDGVRFTVVRAENYFTVTQLLRR